MRTHKYGYEIPKSIADAKLIDNENKNKLWKDAIDFEMKNVRITFQLFNADPITLKGYKYVTTHLIFDIKLGKTSDAKSGVSRTVTKQIHHLLSFIAQLYLVTRHVCVFLLQGSMSWK